MGHYRDNIRDIEFGLLEVLRVHESSAAQASGLDETTIRSVLTEVAETSRTLLADGYAASDREPVRFDPAAHTVRLPDDFKARFKTFWDAEWWRMFVPEGLGGTATPWTVRWGAFEFVLGANPGVFFYMQCPPFAEVVHREGTAEQRRWAQFMVDRAWGATMVLTEADAGSDVGAGRTRASLQADGSWHISGVKRFITSGEHDLADNIMHLVLARPDGAQAGTKGLSLFLVPKLHFDSETGELGSRNGVFTTNVEDKMGMKISATCEVAFGQHGVPAQGWLLGEVHDGIAQMFQVIAYARLLVAVKATAAMSSGYLTALDFARERIQGTDLAGVGNGARIPIIGHPEVRRSLQTQKAYAEGYRALALFIASLKDEADGEHESAAQADALCSLLLPIAKAGSAERANEQLNRSLCILGGSGFLSDYPIEQYIRDSTIDPLYEGTTAIQSLDLLFRQIMRDRGRTFSSSMARIDDFIASADSRDRLDDELDRLHSARRDATDIVDTVVGLAASTDSQSVYLAGQHCVRLLHALADLMVGWQLLVHADVALQRLSRTCSPSDADYYQGKVATARFFSRTVLPRLASDLAVVTATDNDLMSIPSSSF